MRRREFIAALAGTVGGAFAFGLRPISTRADSVRRIGILMGLSEDDLVVQGFVAAFVAELARLGWVDGRNMQIEQRWTNADVNRASTLAMDLHAFHPDVILCSTTPVTAALRRETATIPVVLLCLPSSAIRWRRVSSPAYLTPVATSPGSQTARGLQAASGSVF
jgi:putative tryptophan/tyrosine transport system substrate-binding protein